MKGLVQFTLLTSFFSLCLEAQIDANFKVPSRIYSIDELDEAIAEAKEEGEPVTYLWGSPKSTCPLHNRDAELALKEAKRFSVVVFLPSTRDDAYDKVSPFVLTALRSKQAGNIIPKLITASPDGTSDCPNG